MTYNADYDMKETQPGGRQTTMSIQTELRDAIKKSGLTHYRLAKDAGVNAGVIDRFVREERDLRLGTAAKIAVVLGLRLIAATSTPKAKSKPKRHPANDHVAEDRRSNQ